MGGGFVVFGKAAVSPEPCEGAFDDPAARFLDEVADALGSGDDLDGPGSWVVDGGEQFAAAIGAVGEGQPERGEALRQGLEERDGAMAVCTLAGVTCTSISRPDVSVAIWRLRPFTFLAASKPRGPPLSVVRALWLSITTAEGSGSRASSPCERATSLALIRAQQPRSRHR